MAERLVDGELGVRDRGQRPRHTGRHQHAVLDALVDHAEDVAGPDPIAGACARGEPPAPRAVERGRRGAGGEEVTARLGEPGQRPAGPVEHGAEQAGAELGGQRGAGRGDGRTDREAGRVLEDLQRRGVAGEPDHLAEQAARADPHQLVQRCVAQRPGLGQRSGDAGQGRGHVNLTR